MVSSDASLGAQDTTGRDGSAAVGPSLPLALIVVGAVLNAAWLGFLGWAAMNGVARLLG